VRNERVLQSQGGDKYPTNNDHILHRNCLLKHVIDGKVGGKKLEMTVRRGRRRKQLLDDFKETRGYWKLKEAGLDRNIWRTRFGWGYRPVVRQTTG
jgi:hypothetical protein